jgi:hypothetical protein
MKIFTPDDFKKYFYASLFLAIICLILAIVAIGESGQANIIEQSIAGQGDLYTRHDSPEASDLAIAENASVVYQAARKWGTDVATQTFSSSYIVSGARGGYKNQYVVKASGAGYKHSYQATKITGDFSGSSEVSLTIGDDGAESLDSLILMDGNATFRGRIYSTDKGRPLTAEEMDAVGKLMIRSYLNITQPITMPEGWLDFCNTFSDALPVSVGPVKLVPINGTA